MLGTFSAEGGDAVDDLVLLEEDAIHDAFLSMFAPSAPRESSTET